MRTWKTIFDDLRYSWRVLVRNPGFKLVAVVGVALGIGANSAIFTAMNAVPLFVSRRLRTDLPLAFFRK